MKRIRSGSRDMLFAAVMLLVLFVLTATAAMLDAQTQSAIPLDSSSTAPDGTLALFRWLGQLDFNPNNRAGEHFAIPAETALVFLLEPRLGTPVTDADLEIITEWVENGGILIFASDNAHLSSLAAHFGFRTQYLETVQDETRPAFPLMTNPPLTGAVTLALDTHFAPDETPFTPLTAVKEGPTVLSTPVGRGRVVLSASTRPFTNEGLKSPGSAEFILNLLSDLPEGAVMWFDEWHHGQRELSSGMGGPSNWLRSTRFGNALLYAAAVMLAWLALSGRAFGRREKLENLSLRRSPMEYIQAMANLNRRAGNRAALLDHYHEAYKRRLSRRYHIDPGLPDEKFVEQLRHSSPELDHETIGKKLQQLSDPNISETELIKRISESTQLH